MKKIIIILLAFSFLVQSGIKTAITCTFLANQDYISKVYCVNKNKPTLKCEGKCHLKKELTKEEQKEKELPNSLKEKFEDNTIHQMDVIVFFIPKFSIDYNLFLELDIPNNLSQDIFRPPTLG